MLQGLFRMNAGWASERRKLHPAERTDESLLVSESLRFGRWRPHFPSSRRSTATPPCPPLRGSNHFYRSLCSAFLNLITDTRSPKQPTLCSWSALNNTQLIAFIALIIWTVEGEGDEKKNQSAKCWLRGFEGHGEAIFPHYDKWGVTVMQDRAHMATYCNLLHCKCPRRHAANSISHWHPRYRALF